MKLRVGLADVCAALIVAVIVVMPSRPAKIHHAYRNPTTLEAPSPDKLREIARLQAALVKEPPDASDLDALVDLLVEHGQSDDAVRIATDALARGATPEWQAELAMASAYTERLELDHALEWAEKARVQSPPEERVRIGLFIAELERGLKAIDEGIDPRREPARFRDYVQDPRPPIRVN
jgi:tetratricopeptide (TPR) repeat protein